MSIFPKHKSNWIYLREDVMALSFEEGQLLLSLQTEAIPMNKLPIEILDLLRYKIYKSAAQLQQAQRNRNDLPFVFTYNKN